MTADVRREYERIAIRYDQRWSSYVKSSVDETLKRLNLEPSERLMDIGCGSGPILQALSTERPSARLTGLDLSSQMLDIARKKLREGVALTNAQVQQLPFRTGSFDVVVSSSSLHYWQDPNVCLLEIARVLRTGGALVITDWCHDYLACRFYDMYLNIFNRAFFRVYGQSECKTLLEYCGFGDIRVDRYKISWFWGMMTARANAP